MARARAHEDCPAGGHIYTAYIQQGARGQVRSVPIGTYCAGCHQFWPAASPPVTEYLPQHKPQRAPAAAPPSLNEVRLALLEMERDGLVMKVGTTPEGKDIWDLTPQARALKDTVEPEQRKRGR